MTATGATAAEDFLSERLRAAFPPSPPARLGVAVSGGGDSMALLHLAALWARDGGPEIHAVTVDHRLRAEAALEAATVARGCAALGVSHDTLIWQGWDGRGNLQGQARQARYRLMADWAQGHGITTVALGHTADDQAETFLMRLARGSGVDGLAAMAGRRRHLGVDWVRPLMWSRRCELRDWLTARKIGWIEDPSNDDPVFDRVQARRALASLAPLGITTEGLIATADRLRLAREALAHTAHDLARRAARIAAGDVILDRALLEEAPLETQLRLLSHALCWVASAEYRPRFSALNATYGAALQGRRTTLHGCLVMPTKREFRITREAAAVASLVAPATERWDSRWRLTGPSAADLTLRALGETGLAQCPDWRASGHPRATLLAAPAVWAGDLLVAAPLAGRALGWSAELHRGDDDFFTTLIVH